MEGENSPTEQRRLHKPLRLVRGDIELISLIYEHRLARIDNLSILTGRSYKKVHGRLLALARNGYLKRIILPLQKHIYALGGAALPVLVEQGIASVELATERLRSRELRELFLKHEMMVVDIHTMLSAAALNQIELVAWKEGWRVHDHVDIVERGVRRRLPVYPDAFFTLQNREGPAGQNGISFFLEADRSTTTHARFAEKIVAYWNYLQQGLHTKKHGIRAFRMVTITLTAERARNLCTLAASVLPPQARRYFLFASMESFSIAQPAGIVVLANSDVTDKVRVDVGSSIPVLARIFGAVHDSLGVIPEPCGASA